KISERRARSVAELRAMGAGVERVLLMHGNDRESSDLFQAVLTMLDPDVALTVVSLKTVANGSALEQDLRRAEQVERAVQVRTRHDGATAMAVVDLARQGQYQLLIVSVAGEKRELDVDSILKNAPCRVFLAAPAAVPLEPEA